MATKSIRLRLDSKIEEKAKELYKRLYPRHKYDLAILLEELIDQAAAVKEKLNHLTAIENALQEANISALPQEPVDDTVE